MLRALLMFTGMLICTTALATPTQSQLDSAIAEVKSEEKVFDASWEDLSLPTLEARLFDDGSQRNGYAGYLCMILSEHGINGGVVRVIDVVSQNRRVLGKARCK